MDRTDWPWWWSSDQERYHGPCSTRSKCILEAWSEDERGCIFVMQAVHGEINTDIFHALAEQFDEANEELADGGGDYLSSRIPDAEWDRLAKLFSVQISALVRKHGVKPWAFAHQGPEEVVDFTLPTLAALPADAVQIIAELASAFSTPWTSPSYLEDEMRRLKEILAPVELDQGAD